MTTQYTPILKLALPVTGELSGTWGDVVNDNITSMVEQAIAGLATISTWTGNSKTLTTANGTTSESRCAMLVAQNGAGLAAAGEIICPASSKLYVLKNDTSYAITLKTAAGTGVAVASGNTAFLFCDGTNVNACVTTIVDGRVTGNLTVDGNATINGNTTLGNATSDTITATARFASDLVPSTDNARDLGSTANSWKDLYIDGTAYLALVDINGGTIDGVSIGASTAATIINVDNLRLDGNTISSTDTNGNVVIAPNGTGDVQLDADTVRVGDSGAAATLTSNGAGALTVTTGGAADLTLSTNSGTTSGTIVIANGAGGNITLTPEGTGDVILSADRVQIGDANTDTTLTTNGTGSLNLTTNNGTNSGTIQIAQGANGNITLTPNGTGSVSVPKLVWSNGTSGRVPYLTTGGQFTDDADMTFDGTTLTVNSLSVTSGVVFSGGTANSVVYLNASKQATTSANLTFDGTTLTAANFADSSLTSGRVTLAGASGNLTDSANLTFSGQQLTVQNTAAATGPSSPSYAISASGGNNLILNLVANGEAYTLNTASSRYLYYQSGTVLNISTNYVSGTGSAALIDFNAYNAASGATDLYLGAVSGANANGAAIFVLGRRTGATSWAESLRIDENGGLSTTPAASGNTVFNENGVDSDFRVESDTQTHMFFVDASTDRIGIRTSTPGDVFEIYGGGSGTGLFLNNMGTTNGGRYIYDQSNYFNIGALGSSGAPYVGYAVRAEYAAGNTYVSTTSIAVGRAAIDVGAGGNGNIRIWTGGPQTPTSGSALTDWSLRLTIDPDGNWVQNSDGGTEVVFNNNGVDQDFRIESDGYDYMFFIDAGANAIGINDSSPTALLQLGMTGTANIANNVQTKVTDFAAANRFGTTGLTNNNDGIFFGMGVENGIPAGLGFMREASGWNTQIRFYTNNITSGPDSTAAMQEKMRIESSAIVINETGADQDFRVESDNNTHALFVDAGSDYVSMGTSSNLNNGQLHVLAPSSRQAITAQVTTNGNSLFQGFSSAGGSAVFQVTGNGDLTATGSLATNGNVVANLVNGGTIPSPQRYMLVESNTNNAIVSYALGVWEGGNNRRGSMFLDDSTGTWGWDVTASSGVPIYQWRRAGTEYFRVGDEVVVNEGSNDIDFRVESDANTHMLFVDAGNNGVNIGNNGAVPPVSGLRVAGATNPAGGIVGVNQIIGYVASNYSGTRYWVLHVMQIGSTKQQTAFNCMGDVHASSYTTWNLSNLYIRREYDTYNVFGSITGVIKNSVTVSIVDISYNSNRYIAIKFAGGDPGIEANLIGYLMDQQYTNGTDAFFINGTAGVTENAVIASY